MPALPFLFILLSRFVQESDEHHGGSDPRLSAMHPPGRLGRHGEAAGGARPRPRPPRVPAAAPAPRAPRCPRPGLCRPPRMGPAPPRCARGSGDWALTSRRPSASPWGPRGGRCPLPQRGHFRGSLRARLASGSGSPAPTHRPPRPRPGSASRAGAADSPASRDWVKQETQPERSNPRELRRRYSGEQGTGPRRAQATRPYGEQGIGSRRLDSAGSCGARRPSSQFAHCPESTGPWPFLSCAQCLGPNPCLPSSASHLRLPPQADALSGRRSGILLRCCHWLYNRGEKNTHGEETARPPPPCHCPR